MTQLLAILVFTLGSTPWPPPAGQAIAPRAITFPTADGATISADVYGEGQASVVLAHGAGFDKASWSDLASTLAGSGLRVLALDFRGYGRSTGGSRQDLHEDVLGAVRYLQGKGANRISVLGGSMGGGAAARAATQAAPGDIDRLILLSASPIPEPERLQAGSTLFIGSRDEGMVSTIKEQFERAPEPKRLELLDGSAHAQHIFKTPQAAALTSLIQQFLVAN